MNRTALAFVGIGAIANCAMVVVGPTLLGAWLHGLSVGMLVAALVIESSRSLLS